MKRVWKPLALMVLCGATCAAAYFATPRASTPSSPPAIPLRIPADRLHFGTVWEDEAFLWKLPVHNDGKVPIEVQNVAVSCTCVTVAPREFIVPPGACVELRVVINHTVKQQPDGGVSVSLTPSVKNPATGTVEQLQWQLEGTARKHLLVARTLNLTNQSELVQLQPWTFPLESPEPLAELTAVSEIPDLRASVVPTDSDGQRFLLTLTPPPRLSPREIEGKVVLTPVSRRAGQLPIRRVNLVGQIVPDTRLDPGEVLVAGRLRGEVIEETVTVSSYSNQNWRIESVAPEGAGLTAERVGENAVRVRQIVSQLGRQRNQVTLVVTAEDRRVTVVVPVSYTGLDAE